MKPGWVYKKLGDVCLTGSGGTPLKSRKAFYENGTIPWLLSGEVSQGEIWSAKKYITQKGLENSSARLFPKNTVLVAMYGATAGQVGILRFEAATNQAVCGILPSKSLIAEFLYYVLLSKKDELVAQAAGNAQPNISQIKIKNIELPIPPLPEQKRIVAILDKAFEGITTTKANAEKNLQNARALFESHLEAAFSQRGKGWAEKRLDEICTFNSGGTPSKKKNSYWSGKIPWISGRDMNSTQLFDSTLHISKSAVDESSTRMAPTGTLLILVRGMGLAHGAKIAELMVPCAFNQDIRAIHPNPDLFPRYLLFALRDRINSSDTVLSNAAHGTLKIDSVELQKVMIPYPSREQQQRIVTVIDSLAEKTQHLERIYQQKLAALEGLKKSLLHQAFSGQL